MPRRRKTSKMGINPTRKKVKKVFKDKQEGFVPTGEIKMFDENLTN